MSGQTVEWQSARPSGRARRRACSRSSELREGRSEQLALRAFYLQMSHCVERVLSEKDYS
jgi:hypothetical protein